MLELFIFCSFHFYCFLKVDLHQKWKIVIITVKFSYGAQPVEPRFSSCFFEQKKAFYRVSAYVVHRCAVNRQLDQVQWTQLFGKVHMSELMQDCCQGNIFMRKNVTDFVNILSILLNCIIGILHLYGINICGCPGNRVGNLAHPPFLTFFLYPRNYQKLYFKKK